MATATPHIDDVRLEVERVKASPLISNINVCVEEVTNLIDKSSSISSSGASGSGSCINRRNSDSARQKQQHYKYNVNTCIPVRTEFVYADGGKEAVQLCGDWNRWAPISMELESEGIWSVITVVPSGYREFCYVVDGIYHVSKRHPSNSDSTCNWRVVNGPPSSFIRRRRNERFAIMRFADQAAAYLRMFILYYFYPRKPDHALPHIVTDTFAPVTRKKKQNYKHTIRSPYRIAALFLIFSIGSILYFKAVHV